MTSLLKKHSRLCQKVNQGQSDLQTGHTTLMRERSVELPGSVDWVSWPDQHVCGCEPIWLPGWSTLTSPNSGSIMPIWLNGPKTDYCAWTPHYGGAYFALIWWAHNQAASVIWPINFSINDFYLIFIDLFLTKTFHCDNMINMQNYLSMSVVHLIWLYTLKNSLERSKVCFYTVPRSSVYKQSRAPQARHIDQ